MIKKIITDWKLSVGEYKDISCTAPCSVISVFQENGIIPPIHTGDNIDRLLPAPAECRFECTVPLDDNAASRKHIYLKLDGIAANAELLFNGRSYGFMRNPDREFVFEVTDGAVAGDNRLVIRAFEPLHELFYVGREKSGAPYIPDMGIVGKCTVCAANYPIIDAIRVTQKHEDGKVTLGIRVDTLGNCQDMRAVATLVSPVGRLYFAGITGGEGTLIVPSPEYWMPSGYGSQSLYKLTVTLYNGDEAEDSMEVVVGLRDPAIVEGEMSMGGVRIPLRCSSYVRDDVCVPIPDRARSERMIKAIYSSRMNMLHILDSGIHPDEHLYELCDRYGIIISQQISLTYSPRSSISQYVSMLKNELPRMLDMLARHPSVCAVDFAPVYDKTKAIPEGEGVIEEFLLSCKRVIDPIMAEYRSSFVYPDVMGENTRVFSVAPSPSLPTLRTVEEIAPASQMNLLSPVMESHADSFADVQAVLLDLASRYRYAASFPSLVYASELSSAVGMREQVMRARSESASASVALGRFNDSRPVISPSLVDHRGRHKAAYFLAKKFFAPVALFADTDGERVIFTLSNETAAPYVGTVNFALYDDLDNCVLEGRRRILCDAGKTACLVEDLSSSLPLGKEHYYVIYDIFDGTTTSEKESILFVDPKRFAFRAPSISFDIKGSGREYELVLSSQAYATGVFVDFCDVDAEFSSNFVDVHRDYPIRLSFKTDSVTTAEHLRSVIRIKSVYDIGNN